MKPCKSWKPKWDNFFRQPVHYLHLLCAEAVLQPFFEYYNWIVGILDVFVHPTSIHIDVVDFLCIANNNHLYLILGIV